MRNKETGGGLNARPCNTTNKGAEYMTHRHVITAGEYLGICGRRGYIYSVFRGYAPNGKKLYSVCAVKNGNVDILITFEGEK